MNLFAEEFYATRRQALQKRVAQSDVTALVIGVGAEMKALTGHEFHSHERLTALVVTADSQVLIAPATDAASLPALTDVTVQSWRDGENPYAAVANVAGGPAELGRTLTADHVFGLQAVLPETRLMSQRFADMFMIKDPAEIAELAKAGAAIDRVHEQAPALLVAGRTEAEVAAELAALIRREHAEVDFVIVGSGPNGANPHHDFSDRVLQPGDPVVVDIGGTLDTGYHSDSTRTYVVPGAAASPEFQRAYQVVLEAQQAAAAAARPGMTAGELDAVARDIITAAGFGNEFSHRLGHGIGLEIHEQPFIIAGSDLVLEEGMAFSIEPGVYVDGQFGVRIEDIVTLTDTGARSLNNAPKALEC